MITCGVALTAFWGIVSSLLLLVTDGDQEAKARLAQLQTEVTLRDYEFRLAEHALLAARARRALDEGRRETAAGYYRKLVVAVELEVTHVERIRRFARGCISEIEYLNIVGELAIARCGLAEAEGRPDVLVTQLPKAIACLKVVILGNTKLRQCGVISPAEAIQANEKLAGDLRRAEQRLKAVKKALREAAGSE